MTTEQKIIRAKVGKRRLDRTSYGRFERRIPVEDVEEDKANASFHNGVLTVTLPKTAQAQRQVKRIAIRGT